MPELLWIHDFLSVKFKEVYHYTGSNTISHFTQREITIKEDKLHLKCASSVTTAIWFHHCHKHISHLPFENILPLHAIVMLIAGRSTFSLYL